jgi:hypothetical protein
MKARHLLAAILLTGASAAPSASAQLTRTWLQIYDGTLGLHDFARDVAIDAAGNSYVVGWEPVFLPPNLYVPHMLTMKYDPQGNLLWTREFHAGGATLPSTARLVALAPNSDVVVAGTVNNGHDWAVVRYDSQGVELWSYVHPIGIGWVSKPLDLGVDATGAAYVVGDIGLGGTEWLLFKVDSSGALAWAHTDDGGGQGASAAALAVDTASAAIYVVGNVTIGSLDTQVSLQRFDLQGSLVWQRTYGGTGFVTFDGGSDVGLDANGDVLLAGTIHSGSTPGHDLAVLKHDPGGTLLWQTVWNSPGNTADVAYRLAIDPGGAAVAVGSTEIGGLDDDALVVVVEADGTLRWAKTYAGTAALSDEASDVGVDAAGRVVVAGMAVPLGGGDHLFVAQYDVDGTLLSEDLYGGPLSKDTYPFALAVAGDGRAWVCGDSPGSGGIDDAVTIHYQPTSPAAVVTSRNGTGLNPEIFDTVTRPVLGKTWTSTIDAGAIGGSGFTVVAAYKDPLDPGIVFDLGEILIDLSSAQLFVNWSTVVGGVSTHNVPVPNNPAFSGFTLSTQAFLSGAGAAGTVTNALDLVVGSS